MSFPSPRPRKEEPRPDNGRYEYNIRLYEDVSFDSEMARSVTSSPGSVENVVLTKTSSGAAPHTPLQQSNSVSSRVIGGPSVSLRVLPCEQVPFEQTCALALHSKSSYCSRRASSDQPSSPHGDHVPLEDHDEDRCTTPQPPSLPPSDEDDTPPVLHVPFLPQEARSSSPEEVFEQYRDSGEHYSLYPSANAMYFGEMITPSGGLVPGMYGGVFPQYQQGARGADVGGGTARVDHHAVDSPYNYVEGPPLPPYDPRHGAYYDPPPPPSAYVHPGGASAGPAYYGQHDMISPNNMPPWAVGEYYQYHPVRWFEHDRAALDAMMVADSRSGSWGHGIGAAGGQGSRHWGGAGGPAHGGQEYQYWYGGAAGAAHLALAQHVPPPPPPYDPADYVEHQQGDQWSDEEWWTEDEEPLDM